MTKPSDIYLLCPIPDSVDEMLERYVEYRIERLLEKVQEKLKINPEYTDKLYIKAVLKGFEKGDWKRKLEIASKEAIKYKEKKNSLTKHYKQMLAENPKQFLAIYRNTLKRLIDSLDPEFGDPEDWYGICCLNKTPKDLWKYYKEGKTKKSPQLELFPRKNHAAF